MIKRFNILIDPTATPYEKYVWLWDKYTDKIWCVCPHYSKEIGRYIEGSGTPTNLYMCLKTKKPDAPGAKFVTAKEIIDSGLAKYFPTFLLVPLIEQSYDE